jgi:hypothetical protein
MTTAPTARFSDEFEDAGVDCAGAAIESVMTFNSHVPISAPWSLDTAAQQITLGDMALHAVPIGTFSEDYKCWVWAWGNDSLSPDDPGLAQSLRLREIGEQRGIPELTQRQVNLDHFENLRMGAEKLALVSMGLLGARGYVGVTIRDFRLYLVSDDPSVPGLTERGPDQLDQVLRNAERWFDADPQDIAVSYVEHLGGKYQQIPGGIAISIPDGPSATLYYRTSGLDHIGPPLIPLL